MNPTTPLEAELTAWLADTAAPRVPDYVDDLLERTSRASQRPRWSLPAAWLPVGIVMSGRIVRHAPWRTVGIAALLLMLLIATVAVYVASRPRVPPPFGPAANGLVAYEQAGDILTVDPISGTVRPLIAGQRHDYLPRWSPDGTRLFFLRSAVGGDVPVIAAADGSGQIEVGSEPLPDVDPDGIAWSPDGRFVALAARGIFLVDTESATLTALDVDYQGLEVYWRPSAAAELMFLGGDKRSPSLRLVSIDDGGVQVLPPPVTDHSVIRPGGWTVDGRRFLVHTARVEWQDFATHIVDVTTGDAVVLDIGFGRVSNDGTRVVGLVADGSVCVMRISGGPCRLIGTPSQSFLGPHHEAVQWSPDDQWIVTRLDEKGPSVLLDPDGGAAVQPEWLASGVDSWQRRAP